MARKRVAPKDYKNPDTRALTSTTFIGKLAETLGLKEGLSPDQKKTKPASPRSPSCGAPSAPEQKFERKEYGARGHRAGH